MKCRWKKGKLGPCRQPAEPKFGVCEYHYRMSTDPRFRVDPYYHSKVLAGTVQLTGQYISEVEMNALFGGRPRHDGRRLDAWTL